MNDAIHNCVIALLNWEWDALPPLLDEINNGDFQAQLKSFELKLLISRIYMKIKAKQQAKERIDRTELRQEMTKRIKELFGSDIHPLDMMVRVIHAELNKEKVD